MADKKKKKLSILRFVAIARELLTRDPERYEIVRVSDAGEFVEVQIDEARDRQGSYELRERVRTDDGETWERHSECVNELEEASHDSAERERDRLLARETERLNDRWALLSAVQMKDRDWYSEKNKECFAKIEAQAAELAKKDDQIRELLLAQEDVADAWVDLAREGLHAVTNYRFSSALREKLNRIAPELTAEQAEVLARVLNHPAFSEGDRGLPAGASNGVATQDEAS